MASQQDIGGTKLFRQHIKNIKLQPQTSFYDIVVELKVDGVRVHKLQRIEKGQTLQWIDLYAPYDAREGSTVTVQVTEIHTFQDRAGSATYQVSKRMDSDEIQIECNSNGKQMFEVQIKISDSETTEQAYVDALARVKGMEKEKKSGKLTANRVDHAFKMLLELGNTMAQIDPSGGAKVMFSVCAKARECMIAQNRQDASLCELIESLAGTMPSIESVKVIADTSLKETVVEMLKVVEDASLLIVNFRSRSWPERRIRSGFHTVSQEQVDALLNRFSRLREEFNERMTAQTLRAIEHDRQRERLKELKPVDRASYNPSRQCFNNTRVDIIDDLVIWAQEYDNSTCFAWIHGLAGLGKSSVAASICNRLDDLGALTCSFFCKRDSTELRESRRVLTAIVFGLASHWDAYREAVVAVMQEDLELSSKHIQPLYNALVAEPLKALKKSAAPASRFVVVIDALDECEEAISRKQLLTCLRDLCELVPGFKVIVTSRPELDIQEFFEAEGGEWYTQFDLARYDASADIRSFVQDRLNPVMNIAEWPNDALDRICILANGLFIWASTACKFIVDGFDRYGRLNMVLSGVLLADIDALYATAIRAGIADAADDNMECMRQCLGVVAVTGLQAPLSVRSLVTLLNNRISLDTLERVVRSLSSVLYVDEKLDDAVRLSHPSFMDYITTPSRSKELCVDLELQKTIIAGCCLDTMTRGLKFNICDLETSDRLNRNVPNLTERVQDKIVPSLKYSCLYWSSYVPNTIVSYLRSDLRNFLLGEKLLYWLEALSLLGELSVAIVSLLRAAEYCTAEDMEDCRRAANDMYRFVLTFYDPISSSTPHLYVSALAFAPINSEVSRSFRKLFPNMLAVLDGGDKDWTLCMRNISVSSGVNFIALSPDGCRVASGSSDGLVRIWDAEAGEALLTPLEGHSEPVECVAFSPDGRHVISGSWDKTFRIWDTETGEEISVHNHSEGILSISYSPDGRLVVFGSYDSVACVWDVAAGKPAYESPCDHAPFSVRSVVFSPDGSRMMSSAADGIIRIWDLQDIDATPELLRGHSSRVQSVAFSPDGERIASGSDDTTVRIWCSRKGVEVMNPLCGHSHYILSVAFSPNGSCIVSGSADQTIRVWDAQSGDLVVGPLRGHSGSVTSVLFSSGGTRIISGSSDETIRFWDASLAVHAEISEESPKSHTGHTDQVNSVAFSSDGRFLASGSSDKTVRIWDPVTGHSIIEPLEGHLGYVWSVTFSPDAARVASGSEDMTVRIWDVSTGESIFEPLRGHLDSVRAVSFSPDGNLLVSGSYDKTVRIWCSKTGDSVIAPFAGHSDWVRSVAFSPGGRYVVSGSSDGSARLWDVKTGNTELGPLEGHSDTVTSTVFSPDGYYIASGSWDSTIRVWDMRSGKTKVEAQGHSEWIQSLAFSPDGKRIVSAADDCTLRVWDPETGETIMEPLRGHTDLVKSVAISPNSCRAASGSRDGTVRIWDVEPYMAHDGAVPTLLPDTHIQTLSAFKIDDKTLVSGTELTRHINAELAGWVTKADDHLLLWVPHGLQSGENALVCISSAEVRRWSVVDFTRFVHGEAWTTITDG